MRRLEITAGARLEMSEIVRRIARDKPRAAGRWLARLESLLKGIPRFPFRGRVVDSGEDGEVRQLIFGQYRVLYEVAEKAVSVLSICHGAKPPRGDLSSPGEEE